MGFSAPGPRSDEPAPTSVKDPLGDAVPMRDRPWVLPVFVAFVVLAGPAMAGCLAEPGPAGDGGGPAEPAGASGPALPDEVASLRDALRAAAAGNGTVTVMARPVTGLGGLGGLAFPEQVGDPVAFDVSPSPSRIVTDRTWAEVNATRVPMPFVEAYEGHVEGRPDAPFRLVLTGTWARGVVRIDDRTHLVRVGLDGNLPAPPNGSRAGPAWPAATTGPWPPGRLDPPGWPDRQPDDCLLLVPPHVEPVVGGGAFDGEVLWTDVVLDADAAVKARLGNHSFPMMVAMVHELDAIWAHQVGVRFRLVGLHLHGDPAALPEPREGDPLGPLAEYWNARDVERDLVHLVSGHDHGVAEANCVGGVGDPEVAYTFTPLPWDERFAVFHTNAMAHEVGHIFSAHHHYGNHVESEGATIMIQGYTPGLHPLFSSLSKSVMRGYGQERLDGR